VGKMKITMATMTPKRRLNFICFALPTEILQTAYLFYAARNPMSEHIARPSDTDMSHRHASGSTPSAGTLLDSWRHTVQKSFLIFQLVISFRMLCERRLFVDRFAPAF
jgi:hypothetical protein